MNKIKSIFRFGASVAALALLSTVMMGGCPGGGGGDGPMDVRYVNMASHGQMASSTLTFDTNVFGPLTQYGATPFEILNTTDASAMITDKDGNLVFNTTDFHIPGDFVVNMISLGSDTNVEMVEVSKWHGRSLPGAGEYEVSFVNGVEQSFGVDIYVVNVGAGISGTPVATGMTYTEDSTVKLTFDGLGKDLVAVMHGTTTEMFRTSITPSGGQEYLAVMVSPTGLPGSFKVMNFVQDPA